ncbi:type VI secretion system baseplate subunit TssF, partial [Escherichia coli]
IEKIFSKDFFRINCAPVINLFNKKTEPLRLSEDIDEYQVNVDLYRRNEVLIWNINKVTLHRYEKDSVKEIPLKNLFGLEHSAI